MLVCRLCLWHTSVYVLIMISNRVECCCAEPPPGPENCRTAVAVATDLDTTAISARSEGYIYLIPRHYSHLGEVRGALGYMMFNAYMEKEAHKRGCQ